MTTLYDYGGDTDQLQRVIHDASDRADCNLGEHIVALMRNETEAACLWADHKKRVEFNRYITDAWRDECDMAVKHYSTIKDLVHFGVIL